MISAMRHNNNIFFSIHTKNIINRYCLRKRWSHNMVRKNIAKRISILSVNYGDLRIFPVSELKKNFYEGLKICQ